MKKSELMDILHLVMGEGDRVYSLRMRKKRTWGRRIREIVLDLSFFVGSAPDIPDLLSGVWLLVASDSAGTIVRLSGTEIVETIAVPDWQPEWKKDFRKVIVGDREYIRMGKCLVP